MSTKESSRLSLRKIFSSSLGSKKKKKTKDGKDSSRSSLATASNLSQSSAKRQTSTVDSVDAPNRNSIAPSPPPQAISASAAVILNGNGSDTTLVVQKPPATNTASPMPKDDRVKFTAQYLQEGLEIAKGKLSVEEKLLLPTTGSLDEIIELAEEKRKFMESKRWTIMWKGEKILISDKIAALTGTLNKYAVVGDTCIQHSPEVTALFWGAFRALLQFTTDVVNTRAELLNKMDEIGELVAECELYASIFQDYTLTDTGNKHIADRAKTLSNFYAAVFVFIVKTIFYFEFLKRRQLAKLLPYSIHFQDLVKEIDAQRSQIKDTAFLADLVRAKETSVKIKNIDEMVQDVHKRVESMGMAYDMMTVFVDSFEEFKQETRTEKLEADRRKWRRWLHWVDPKPELRRKLKLRMEGTCEWVYKDPKFEDWYQSSENQTLWIKAKAGTGKSVVVATILDHLEQRNRLLPPSQNPVLLYYFFRQGGKRTDNVRTMLTTLMGQLFDIAVYGDQEFAPAYTEKLFEILKPQYHRHTDKADKGSIEPEELLELLKRMLEQVPTQVMIVLDALDECSAEGRQLIMQNLVSADKFPARFLVTGRPELDINEHLERAAGVVKMLEMDNQKDIDMFVERKIDNEPRLHPHREAIITKISQTTDGMFQYAATMMEMLSGPSGDQTIEELLDIMPSELFKLYGMYVQRLPQDPSLTKLRQTTLMFIAIAKRPVTAKEIAYAHAVKRSGEENFDPTKKFLAREEEVMRASGTLIECQASLLRFSHLTVREFLFSDMDFLLQMGGLDSLCFQNSRLSAELNLHATMALVTVSQLSEVALRLSKSEHVVCELWERDSEFAVPPDGMSAVTYAANYYHAHAAKVAPFDPDGSLFRNLWDKIERLEASELGILWYELLIESPEYVYEYGGPPMALQRNREWRAKFRQQETKQLHYMTSFGFRYLLRRRLQDPGVRDVINLQGMTGDTALHSAISKIQDRELAPEPSSDDLEIVSMLLGVDGIDTNIGNNKGVTPLMLAVGKPISVVELLLQQDGVDVNARSRVGDECTLLHDIIEWDDRDFLLRLLERKELDLNLPVTKHGTSALAQAVVLDRFEIIQLLLARNELNVNATSKSSGETALHIACAGGAQSIRAVEMLLLRHDLLLNITNSEGQTALFAAVEGGSAEVVRTLLDHAADSFDLNQTDGSGNTVLMLAVRLGFTEIVRALSERAGLDFGRRNANGETALLTAASLGYEEITSILLAKSDGFVANMPSEEGFTPLTAAIANAYSDVVPVLLERLDIDVNRRVSCTVLNKRSGIRVSMRGVTPIMIAGFRGLLKSAQALASRKDMYINLEDYNGRTALDYAIKNNYMVTASFLRSKGAFHSIDVLSKISSAPAQLDRAFAKDLRRSRQVVRTESHWCASATIVKYRVLRALPSWCDGGRFAECLGLGIGVRRLELAVVYWAGARQCTGRTDQ